MKALKHVLFLGLFFGLFPLVSSAKLGGQNNILGKFFVSSVKGTVTCVSDSRILELKKGDTIPARGAIIDTAAGANLTIVFSNGTGVYTDEKTHFEIKRFEQEFFAPNNNLRVEPSNSLTLIYLSVGRVVLSTPQLLSGTIMLYETPHASVSVKGEKLLVEVNDKQTLTHVALIAGNVSVVPRGADGNFLSIGKRLKTGEEAFVKYALEGGDSSGAISDKEPDTKKPAIQSVAEAQAGNTPSTGYLGPKGSGGPAGTPGGPAVTTEAKAKVLKIVGFARAKLPGATEEFELKEGALVVKGTVITTDAASELYLETFKGALATLRPMSTMEIEKLTVTKAQSVVKKQSSILKLKSGTVISTIDPATKEINDYGVRTPKGLAHASGTSFSVTVEDDGFSVTTTADSVLFTTPAGLTYTIKAGNVTIAAAGGLPQPPISLSQALANNPAFASVIQTAVTTVATIVQNNLGGLSADSATNLITKVINTAASAIPGQAAAFTAQAVNAVSAPSSSTASGISAAVAAVTLAATSAAPTEAAQIATAATQAAPGQAAVIAAAAAKGAPAQAAQVAAAVTRVVTPSSPTGPSDATIQTATAIAAAVTNSVPNQAAPVAEAVLRAISEASPQATPQTNATVAATIAAGVTGAAPSQAVPVAAIMMKTLTQLTPDASAQSVAQAAALLASSVTSVVPPQAQEVATAVLQAINESLPPVAGSPSVASLAAGLVAASVGQAAPGSEQAIIQAVATATNQSVASVQQSAQQSAAEATAISGQAAAVGQQVAQSVAASSQASQSVAQAESQIAAGSSNVASTSGGAGGSGSGSAGSGSGSSGTSGSGSSSTASNGQTESAGGQGGAGGAGGGAGGAEGSASGAADAGASDKATSIIVTQFDPSSLNDIMAGLQSLQSGQSSVQFNTDTSTSPPTVQPVPTVPRNLPVENTSSAAVIRTEGG
jgi:hypothetical protein